MSYYIIKRMKNRDGRDIHHIIIDSLGEVREFDTPEEAEKLRVLFQANSDSGHEYFVKKVGS